MFRKTVLAIAATAAIGAAALTPTSASAHWHGGGWHGGGGFGHHAFWGGPRFYLGGPAYAAYDPCLRRRWVGTPFGPRLRYVNVCY